MLSPLQTTQPQTPTTYLYVAIIGLMITNCVMGVFFYLQNIDYQQTRRHAQSDRNALKEAKSVLIVKNSEIDRFKKTLGYQYDDVGHFYSEETPTVLSSVYRDLNELELNLPQLTVKDVLRDLVVRKENLQGQKNDLQTQAVELRKTMNQIETRWANLVDIEKTAREKAQRDLIGQATQKEEMVLGKEKQLKEMNNLILALRSQLNSLEEQHKETVEKARLQKRSGLATIKRLEKQVAELSGELAPDELPDGRLIRVDMGTKSAWINRGSKDNLKPGVIFLAYSPRAQKRTPKHAKARMRVTSVKGPSLAQVQILDTKLGNPVVAGDLVTSVLWSPGQTEKIAIAGIVDFNDDGRSDLDQLKVWLAASGTKVFAYTDKAGNHQGGKINGNTSLLVSAVVPGVSRSKDPKEQARLERIRQHVAQMHKAANKHGVKIVSLSQFLKNVGYRPVGVKY